MKILISSQDFWFGPTAQMFSFLKHLFLYWFNGDVFIKNNFSTQIFYDNFIRENSAKNLYLVNNFNWSYDRYVWFYDPEVIFEWKKRNKKTIFLCNLTYLWDDSFLNNYSKNIKIENINLNDTKNHHELILLWYLFADKVFIRNTDGMNRKGKLFNRIKDKLEFIWPIIYPKIYNDSYKKYTLIQLWWQINPMSDNNFYEIYLTLIKKITDNIIWNKKIIVNPSLYDISKRIFNKNDILTTFWQEKYQKLLSESKLLLSPFGINTFFESSYFNLPTYILPEQHLGHIISLINYVWNLQKIKKQSFLLYNKLAYNLDYKNEWNFINFLKDEYIKLINNKIVVNFDRHIYNWENIVNRLNLKKYINKNLNYFIKELLEH